MIGFVNSERKRWNMRVFAFAPLTSQAGMNQTASGE